jgi:hypothetical protein
MKNDARSCTHDQKSRTSNPIYFASDQDWHIIRTTHRHIDSVCNAVIGCNAYGSKEALDKMTNLVVQANKELRTLRRQALDTLSENEGYITVVVNSSDQQSHLEGSTPCPFADCNFVFPEGDLIHYERGK